MALNALVIVTIWVVSPTWVAALFMAFELGAKDGNLTRKWVFQSIDLWVVTWYFIDFDYHKSCFGGPP